MRAPAILPKHLEQIRTLVMIINLGDKVKDRISGFTGIVTARHEYLNGCIRLSVAPDKLDKDGKVSDGYTFDLEQVDLFKAAEVRETRPGGGPRDEPARPAVPSR